MHRRPSSFILRKRYPTSLCPKIGQSDILPEVGNTFPISFWHTNVVFNHRLPNLPANFPGDSSQASLAAKRRLSEKLFQSLFLQRYVKIHVAAYIFLLLIHKMLEAANKNDP